MNIKFKQLIPGELFQIENHTSVWEKIDPLHAYLMGTISPATFYPNEPVKKVSNQSK